MSASTKQHAFTQRNDLHDASTLAPAERLGGSRRPQRYDCLSCKVALGALCTWLLVTGSHSVAQAKVITYKYTAEVQRSDHHDAGLPLPDVGETFDGYFSYDTEIPIYLFIDVFPGPGEIVQYRGSFGAVQPPQVGPPRRLQPAEDYRIQMVDDHNGDTFALSTEYVPLCDFACVVQEEALTISLTDEDETVFDGIELPTELNLSDFERATIRLSNPAYGEFRANITNLIRVPEPLAAPLALAGLLSLVPASPLVRVASGRGRANEYSASKPSQRADAA